MSLQGPGDSIARVPTIKSGGTNMYQIIIDSSQDSVKKGFLLILKKKIKKRQQKQAHQHDTFKLKLHWQLQANDQACT